MVSSPTPTPSPFLAVDFDPFAEGEIISTAPTTESQREIWTSVQMGDEANCAYNESQTLTLRGQLDVEALKAALQALVDRHEALRTTFSPDGTNLCIQAQEVLTVPLRDWSTLPPSERQTKVDICLHSAVSTPFDLEHGPLFRAEILCLEPTLHQVILSAHHIVCDGWSWGVIIPELGKAYTAFKRGQTLDLEAPDTFSDYAVMLTKEIDTQEGQETEQYWIQQFADVAPILQLPTDHPRPPLRTFACGHLENELSPVLIQELKTLGSRYGCSFMTTILSAFEVLIHRLTKQSDLVVGIPAAGQAATGMTNLVGHCVNLLPLRTQLNPEQSFTDYLQQRRSALLDAYDHQKFTFGRLVQQLDLPRDSSRIPLVPVVFNLDQSLDKTDLAFDGLTVAYSANARAYDNFELSVNVTEFKDRLLLEWDYNSALFDLPTAQRQVSMFEALLYGIVANPDLVISRLPLLPEVDHHQLEHWRQSSTIPRPDTTIHALIEAQVERNADAIAVISQNQSLTYDELNQQANRLAHYLRDQGVSPGDTVGIYTNRSLAMTVAILSVLKAGGAYVPLDPQYPQERLAFMAKDAQVKAVLTELPIDQLELPLGCLALDLDQLEPTIASYGSDNPIPLAKPDSPAYVIYTSGSTGKPKGVCISHRGLVNHSTSMGELFALTDRDNVLQFASISFDIAVEEIFPTWLYGATLVLRTEESIASISAFLEYVAQAAITVLDLPTAFWHLWMNQVTQINQPIPPGIRLVAVGGEAASRSAYDLWKQHIGSQCRWINTYGPTEATVTATAYEPKADESWTGEIPIGRPLPNLEVHVLDEQQQLVPIGDIGELYIGGAGVAIGYLNRPEQTTARFLPNPHSPDSTSRLYRTGDRVRYRPDGNLEFVGRIDNQVKIRGFRIELGEVETAICQHPAIRETMVIVREDIPGDKRLVAYGVLASGKTLTLGDLRTFLRAILPDYMVPSALVILDALPLTPSGKLDRKQLPRQEIRQEKNVNAQTGLAMPETKTEQQVASIWCDVLNVKAVGRHDNFFDLGGHSLLAVKIGLQLQQIFDINLRMPTLFEHPTVAALATHIETTRWATAPQADGMANDDTDFEEGEL